MVVNVAFCQQMSSKMFSSFKPLNSSSNLALGKGLWHLLCLLKEAYCTDCIAIQGPKDTNLALKQHFGTTRKENAGCLMFDVIVCPIRMAHTWLLGYFLRLGCSGVSSERTRSRGLHVQAAGQALAGARRAPVHGCCRRFDCRARSLARFRTGQRTEAGVLGWPGYRN